MTLDEVLAAFAAHGHKPRRSGEGWTVTCPNHEDRNPSVMVAAGDKGTLVHCHRGCETADVVGRLGLTLADLFYEKSGGVEPPGVSNQEYDYRDAEGRLRYQVVRMAGKKFRQRRPGGEPPGDGWVWNLKGVTPLLYRLPELLDRISLGETIYVAEGEKDVDALVAAGVAATCNSGGAGKWRPEFGKVLSNAERVVIVADDDGPGHAHADDVAKSLNGASYEIVIAAEGKDAADHLARGYKPDQFVPLGAERGAPAETAPLAAVERPADKPEATPPKLSRRAAVTFSSQRTSWIEGFEGFIPLAMVSILAGLPGLGKSMFGCYLAALESQAGRLCCIAAAEDSIEHTLIPRLVACRADLRLVEFIGIESDGEEAALHLPEHEHQLRTGMADSGASLLIIDPIGSFLGRGVDNWRDTDVRLALGPLKLMAETSLFAVLLVAHLNKGVGGYLDRLANSTAFGQIIRSGMLFGRDPDDEDETMNRVLVSAKLNVGEPPQGRTYRIDPATIPADDGLPPDIKTARLVHTGTTGASVNAVLAVDRKSKGGAGVTKVPEAIELLRSLLYKGPLPAKEVHAAAASCSISMTPLRAAAEQIGVVIDRTSAFPSVTSWRLP